MGFMSKLGKGVMRQLQNRFSVQGVLLGERTEEMEMVEDAMEHLQENTTAANRDAAAEAANIREAVSDLVHNARPSVSGSQTRDTPAENMSDAAQDAHNVVVSDDVSDVETMGGN